MSSSVFFFKLKRFFESILDFFKDISNSITLNVLHIKNHHRTQQTGANLRKVKDRIFTNLEENRSQLRQRNFDDHGFQIGDEDS